MPDDDGGRPGIGREGLAEPLHLPLRETDRHPVIADDVVEDAPVACAPVRGVEDDEAQRAALEDVVQLAAREEFRDEAKCIRPGAFEVAVVVADAAVDGQIDLVQHSREQLEVRTGAAVGHVARDQREVGSGGLQRLKLVAQGGHGRLIHDDVHPRAAAG